MTEWSPISSDALRDLLADHLAGCTTGERSVFDSIRQEPRHIQIDRGSGSESVFVIGEHDGRLLIFDDVEFGFEWCVADPDGVIRDYACSQAGLRDRLLEILDA